MNEYILKELSEDFMQKAHNLESSLTLDKTYGATLMLVEELNKEEILSDLHRLRSVLNRLENFITEEWI